jgi:hypothetical protein
MAYIIKDTTALLNTQITDVGRRRISQGNFNIAYFQLGDSEVCYDCISGSNPTTLQVVVPEYNYQNDTGVPQSNKMGIKYPIFLSSSTGDTNTFGIPFQDSQVVTIFNTPEPRGFFTGSTGSFSALTSSALTVTANYTFSLSALTSGNTFDIITGNTCDATITATPENNQFVTLYLDNDGGCGIIDYPFPILTYKVTDVTGTTITVDRLLPDFSSFSGTGRAIFYPSGMTPYYDSYTPVPYYDGGVFSFELNCEIQQQDVKVWNMNQPWTENPAGLSVDLYKGYQEFGSSAYTSTKQFLGYQSNTGQIFQDIDYNNSISDTYYNNSFGEKIYVLPSEQKTISIIHYTNQGIDNFYGEKFATEPFDLTESGATGQARNFKLEIPTLMWHKSKTGVIGETFYIDPDGFDELNLFQPHFMLSTKNETMNLPGIRYFHLWDTHANDDGYPNRVGKVFPDLKMVVIDDEELCAAMSYKSNRNYTLPAPRLGLVVPNTFNQNVAATSGLLSASTEVLYVTYRFENTGSTNGLHCNYYSSISGSTVSAQTDDVIVRFGNEFPFLVEEMGTQPSGFTCTNVKLICQKVIDGSRPNPTEWREIDVTASISANTGSINIGPAEISGTTFQITKDSYENADFYRLENIIDMPLLNYSTGMTFGEEYFFYGTVKTDVEATIYELRYLINLADSQYIRSSNPTWSLGKDMYFSEVGLFNADQEILFITKLQNPEKRQGVQQVVVKYDF